MRASMRFARPVFALVILGALLCSPLARAQRFGLWAGEESLRLVRHDLRLEVEHPVAEIILTQEFDNPNPRDLEAIFTYPVPAGAVVTGLALWVKGERRPARLLERQQAKEIYEGIVRQKRDPALLERIDGNAFRIRIFPVLARSRARIELRFAQLVEPAAGHGYRVTVRRPPGRPLPSLRLGVWLHGPFLAEGVELFGFRGELERSEGGWSLPSSAAERRFSEDITLVYRAPASFRGPAVASAALAGGERVFVAEVPLPPSAARRQRLALLLDASSSMGPHLPRLRDLGQALLRRLSPSDELTLVPFGLLPRGQVRLLAADPEQRLRWRGALNDLRASGGNSFLPAWRAALAAGARHLVLVTDGGSPYHAEELEQLLRELSEHPEIQVSTVSVPGAANEEQLQAIARQSGGIQARLEGGSELEALAERLLEAPRPPGVALEGSDEALLVGQAPGRLLVAGRTSTSRPSALLRLHTGEAVALPLGGALASTAPSSRPTGAAATGASERAAGGAVSALYGNAAIEARMARIRLFGETPELRGEIIKLSLSHGVVSEYTALLATETDADYQRPTSGEPWQRHLPRAGDDLTASVSGFQSTPEPHEIALLVVTVLVLAGRRRLSARRASRGPLQDQGQTF
jgi:Ca-activated chloride channel homolog